MPVHTPGRRAGSGSALRAVKRAIETKTSRTLHASLNLTSMVDFMSVVVIFLLMNFSASGEILNSQADIIIPVAVQGGELERVPVIAISTTAILLEGIKVEDTGVVGAQGDSYRLENLIEALKKQRETFKEIHPGKEFDKKVIVQAHEDVPYKVIRRIIDTAGEAGYTLTLFAVRHEAKSE